MHEFETSENDVITLLFNDLHLIFNQFRNLTGYFKVRQNRIYSVIKCFLI